MSIQYASRAPKKANKTKNKTKREKKEKKTKQNKTKQNKTKQNEKIKKRTEAREPTHQIDDGEPLNVHETLSARAHGYFAIRHRECSLATTRDRVFINQQ